MTMDRVYRADGPNSWVLDYARMSVSEGQLAPGVRNRAEKRLRAHAEEVRQEIKDGSPEGRSAMRQIIERHRNANVEANLAEIEDLENRAMSDTSTVGFSTPQYLIDLFATYRAPITSYADAAKQYTLPSVGMQLHVPSFTSAAAVDVTTSENTGGATAVPTGAYVADPIDVETAWGYVEVSQQLMDRGGAASGEGGSFDQIIALQIAEQLRAAVDLYVIDQATVSAGTVTEATTLTTALWWDNLNTATEQLADQAGTRLQPTHVHSSSDFAGWVRRQVDSDNRPIWIPDVGAVVAAEPQGEPYCSTGWQGINWIGGGGSWFVDDNIPAQATTNAAQVIVSNMANVLLWTGSPTTVAYSQTNANTLSVVIRTHQYIASVARFANAVQVISGAGYEGLS